MNRIAQTLVLVAVTCVAQAQQGTALGTKKDIVLPAANASGPIVDLRGGLQMLLAVGIVLLLLKFGLPWIVKFLGSKGAQNSGDNIQIKGTVAFGPGTLGIVEVHGKSLLVSATPNSISLVCDLGRQEPATKNQAQDPAFFEILDHAATESEPQTAPNRAVAAAYRASDTDAQKVRDDLAARLDRLARLAE